jgi:Predicted secreted protein
MNSLIEKHLPSAALAVLLAASSAFAGDYAEFRPIGFSPDGKVFAFEEFGVQDGSGFPYANRFYIDTETDEYLKGTPIRVRIDDEAATVGAARAKAAAEAAAIEASSKAAADPGIFAAFAPVPERGNDETFLRYQAAPITPYPFPGGAFSVELSQKPLKPPASCEALDVPIQGFMLHMKEKEGASSDLFLHVDDGIPESRNCPLSYALGGAMIHANPDGTTTHAILVLVRSVGFEGPNGRWLAVTKRLD